MATGKAKSHYAEQKVLNCFLRATSITAPSTIYVSLWTTAPDDSGSGTEVSGGSYARQAITFGAPTNQSPSGALCASNADVLFPAASAGWGTVVAFAIHDASSGGNMLYSDSLTTPLTVTTGMQPQFPSGSLTILED